MNKKILALALATLILFLVGCQPSNSEDNNSGNGGENMNNNENKNVEEKNENGEFVFKGKVTSTSEKKYIEVEIIDSKVAFGTYWVYVGDQTVYLDSDGASITRSDIKVGDTIEIIFGGQVTMSIPPHISAQKIILL